MKKSKKILLFCCALSLAFPFAACKENDKIDMLTNYLKQLDFRSAEQYFEAQVSGSDKESEIISSVQSTLEAQYQQILNEFNADTRKLDDLESLYSLVDELHLSDSTAYVDFKGALDALSLSKEKYTEAMGKMQSEDYETAKKLFAEVIADDQNFAEAQKKIAEAEKHLLGAAFEAIEPCLERKDFRAALEKLKEIPAEQKDTERYEQAAAKINQSAQDYAKEQLDTFFEAGEYRDAENFMASFANTMNGSREIEVLASGLYNTYLEYVSQKAEKLFSEQKFDECIQYLDTARKDFYGDDEQLNALYEQYKPYTPCYADEFEWKLNCSEPLGSIAMDTYSSDLSGNQYQHSICASNRRYEAVSGMDAVLDGKYNRIVGTIAPSAAKDHAVSVKAEIFAQYQKDGEFIKVYTSPDMTTESQPEKFDVLLNHAYAVRLAYPQAEIDQANALATFFDVYFIDDKS